MNLSELARGIKPFVQRWIDGALLGGDRDLGTVGNPYNTLYADTVTAGTIVGTMTGGEWETTGNATIDANQASATTVVYVVNQASGGTANLDVEGSIVVGGTVDGVDISFHNSSTAQHGATGAVVGTTNTQTLSGKTLTSPIMSTIVNTGTLTLPTATDTLVGRATTDTLTNKTISVDSNTISGVAVSSFVLSNASGYLDGTVAQKAIPSGVVVGTTDTQVLSAKTFTLPQINDATADHQYIFAVSELAADRTMTLPLLAGNDVFVFADFVQTLTNKTLTSAVLTTPTIADFTNAQHAHTGAASGGTIAHSSTTGRTANDHHNQSHVLATNLAMGPDHTISGATAGHVLRASSATAAAFAAIADADLPSTIVRTSRALTAGAGLTGGGDLSADRAFAVGAGLGITVNADDVALTTPGSLSASSTNASTGNHTHAIDSTIARSAITITAGAGLTGGGDLTANRTLDVGVSGLGLSVGSDAVALASSSNPGAAASILATDASGALTLVRATLSQATGTAPLTVSSTTVVANLNADKADGYDFNQDVRTTASPSFVTVTASTSVRTPLIDAAGNLAINPATQKSVFSSFTYIDGALKTMGVGVDPDGAATLDVLAVNNADHSVRVKQKSGQTGRLWRIEDTTGQELIVLDSVGNLQSGNPGFVSGLTGWQIQPAGNAEFNNIWARGEFHASTFVMDEFHATGGTLVTATAGTLENDAVLSSAGDEAITDVRTTAFVDQTYLDYRTTSVSGSGTGITARSIENWIEISDPPSGHAQLFAVGDILRCKTFNGTSVYDLWLRVNAITDMTTYYRYHVEVKSGTYTTLPAGSAVIRYGQAGDGLILQTADLDYAPYLDIFTVGAEPWNGDITPHVRLGRLDGVGLPGISGVEQYGLVGGTDLSDATSPYFVLSNLMQKMYRIDSEWHDGTNPTVSIAASGVVRMGTDVESDATTGFKFDPVTGNLQIGSAEYAGSVTIYGSITLTNTIANTSVTGLGTLSTKNAVDLATAEVTNKSLANVDSTANTKLSGIETGATVGAAWGTNLTGRPTELTDGRVATALNASGTVITKVVPASVAGPSASGLYLGSDYLGFYNGSAWRTYMSNAGHFYLTGVSGNALAWDGSTLSIVGGGTFSGALSAATGTFAGSLSAATGSFSGAITASSGAISGPLTMVSGSIAIGATPPTSATVGTGIWLDSTGLYGLSSSVLQAKIGSDGKLTAGGGNVVIEATGLYAFDSPGGNKTFGVIAAGATAPVYDSYNPGDVILGDQGATEGPNVKWDANAGQLLFRDGGTVQAYMDTDGSIKAGAGAVSISSVGIGIEAHTADAYSQPKTISWLASSAIQGSIGQRSFSTRNEMYVNANSVTGKNSAIRIYADSPVGYASTIDLQASIAGASLVSLQVSSGAIEAFIGTNYIQMLSAGTEFGNDVDIYGDVYIDGTAEAMTMMNFRSTAAAIQ